MGEDAMSGTAAGPAKPKRKTRPHIRPKAPKLRTPENAQRICELTAEGNTLRHVARTLGVDHSAIIQWLNEDEAKGGTVIAHQYARATAAKWRVIADELLDVADDRSYMGRTDAAAVVTQQRLAVDTRKWLLSKMLPKTFGDKVEISHDPDAPVITRIELVAVHPKQQLEPPTIEGADDGSDTSD
jgi:hypothetical protein